MAIARDQVSGLGQQVSGTTVTAAWTVNPAAGSTVLLFVQCAQTPSSVKDNGATQSTFTLDVHSAGGHGAFVYRADGITLPSSGSYAVTVTIGTASAIQAIGASYTGKSAGGPAITNNGSGTSTSVSSGAAAPAAAGGLVFGGFSDSSGLNPETITFTSASPLAEVGRNTNGSSWWPMAAADGLTGASQTLTWTLGDSVAWGAAIAAYDASGGGGGGGLAAVGTLVSATDSSTNVTRTLSVSPAAAGNLLGLFAEVVSTSITVQSVSGGGCTAWTRVLQYSDGWAAGPPSSDELWIGVVTTAGASTITITGTASFSGVQVDSGVQEFSAFGANTVWKADTGQASGLTNAASTSITWPSLSPSSGAAELYFGRGRCHVTVPASGTPAGFTWQLDADSEPYVYGFPSAPVSPSQVIASAESVSTAALVIASRKGSDSSSAAESGPVIRGFPQTARQWVSV